MQVQSSPCVLGIQNYPSCSVNMWEVHEDNSSDRIWVLHTKG